MRYETQETDWDPDDMAKVAVHEAGHAVVAWPFGLPLKRIYLDLATQRGCGRCDRPLSRARDCIPLANSGIVSLV